MSIELAQRIPVNDTEIAYREVGHGRPLVLLHGGLVSASEAFVATSISYAGHLQRLAQTSGSSHRTPGLPAGPGTREVRPRRHCCATTLLP